MTDKKESIMSVFLITGLILTSLMIVGNGVIFWKLNQARTNQNPCVPEISMAEITEVVFNSFDFGISVEYDKENGTNNPLIRIEFEIHEGWFFYFWELSFTTNLTNINMTVSITHFEMATVELYNVDDLLMLFMNYNEFGNSTLYGIHDGPWYLDNTVQLTFEDVSNILLIGLLESEVST